MILMRLRILFSTLRAGWRGRDTEKFTDELKAELPLKRIWGLVPEEETKD